MLLIVKRAIVIWQSLVLDEQFQYQERPKDRNSQHNDGILVGAIASDYALPEQIELDETHRFGKLKKRESLSSLSKTSGHAHRGERTSQNTN